MSSLANTSVYATKLEKSKCAKLLTASETSSVLANAIGLAQQKQSDLIPKSLKALDWHPYDEGHYGADAIISDTDGHNHAVNFDLILPPAGAASGETVLQLSIDIFRGRYEQQGEPRLIALLRDVGVKFDSDRTHESDAPPYQLVTISNFGSSQRVKFDMFVSQAGTLHRRVTNKSLRDESAADVRNYLEGILAPKADPSLITRFPDSAALEKMKAEGFEFRWMKIFWFEDLQNIKASGLQLKKILQGRTIYTTNDPYVAMNYGQGSVDPYWPVLVVVNPKGLRRTVDGVMDGGVPKFGYGDIPADSLAHIYVVDSTVANLPDENPLIDLKDLDIGIPPEQSLKPLAVPPKPAKSIPTIDAAPLVLAYKPDSVPPQTSVQQFLNDKGRLILFRTLQSDWNKGSQGEWSNREPGGYSYSLNPYIADWWHIDHRVDGFVVIAQQSIANDGLTFPDKVENMSGKYKYPDVFLKPLKPETKLSEIHFYHEVRVPLEKEHPILSIRRSAFLEIIRGYNGSPFALDDLLEKIRNHPQTRALEP